MPTPTTTYLGYPIIDADNHYYESEDCFTRHLDPKFADRKVVFTREGGEGRWLAGDRRMSFTTTDHVDHAPVPGARAGFFSGKSEIRFDHGPVTSMIDPHEHPPLIERSARLKLMDEQGIQAIIQVPTIGVLMEHDIRFGTDALYGALTAFNRWLEEDWGYGADQRIFSCPLLSLADVDLAARELERVAAAGAKFVFLKAGPVGGRSPADPHFDPFWARAQETGIKPIFHIGNSGYTEMISAQWGDLPNPPIQNYSAFQIYTSFIDRPIADTLAALVFGNLFGRFPDLGVLSLENGSAWVPGLLTDIDKAANHASRWPFGALSDKPSEIFREHVWIAPFHEDDVKTLTEILPIEHILFGSDYPHSEGLAEPIDFAKFLDGLPDATVKAIMRDNTARLLGIAA